MVYFIFSKLGRTEASMYLHYIHDLRDGAIYIVDAVITCLMQCFSRLDQENVTRASISKSSSCEMQLSHTGGLFE